MARRHFQAEQIIRMLRRTEIELAQGRTVAEVCRKLEITVNTYYRWRKEYGGLKVDQARRLKDLARMFHQHAA